MDIKPNDLPFARVEQRFQDFIFADLSHVRNEMFTYYAPLSQLNNFGENQLERYYAGPK